MADLKYYDIIIRPVITERSMSEMSNKKYTFFVHTNATKIQVREAVEKMFPGTFVKYVNTINNHPKVRRRNQGKSQIVGVTAKKKKAVVQLTDDSKEIEIFQGM